MTTRDEAKRELQAAKRAPLIVTVGVALVCVVFVGLSDERRIPLSLAIPFVGLFWAAMLGISMRRLKLAALLVDEVENEEA
ncbi:MAG: hypothetical protein ACYS47_15645 [Planctomycetota bacterium]|jgi:hypothetical protein